MRILLCDDHRLFGETLEVLLAARGHEVVGITTDVHAAADLLGSLKVDVCLLDLQLAEGTSVPFVPSLLERSPDTKIVILSGTDDVQLVRSALAAGAVAATRKSDEIDKIIDVLERVSAGETVPVPTLPGAVGDAGSSATPSAAEHLASYLTSRERDVLTRLVRGESTASLARSIGIKQSTARTHVQNLLTKLGVHSKLEAVAFAITHGIVDVPDDVADDAEG
jgi:two-component system, NarL family, nitrate/nitrite response regulator NarL